MALLCLNVSIMTEENKIKSETDKLSSFKGYGNWGPQVFSWDYNGEGSLDDNDFAYKKWCHKK